MAEDVTTLDLAIVRNRLIAGKADSRDEALLQAAVRMADDRMDNVYMRVLRWALLNALSDIREGALDVAAREVDLVHNIPDLDKWKPWDEKHFLRGAISTYMETATVERTKALFAQFADSR